uniref:Uncharacterized protein n=1 Tax=Caenorhabditis japonica TaxID=281687 RepID=A0A8R1DJQ6_CAEJA
MSAKCQKTKTVDATSASRFRLQPKKSCLRLEDDCEREYLELQKIRAVASNNKIYYGESIPNAFVFGPSQKPE